MPPELGGDVAAAGDEVRDALAAEVDERGPGRRAAPRPAGLDAELVQVDACARRRA